MVRPTRERCRPDNDRNTVALALGRYGNEPLASDRHWRELIWKDRLSTARILFCQFDSTPSAHPAYQAIRVRTLLGSSQLIGRAATTMNHSDIRGLGTA